MGIFVLVLMGGCMSGLLLPSGVYAQDGYTPTWAAEEGPPPEREAEVGAPPGPDPLDDATAPAEEAADARDSIRNCHTCNHGLLRFDIGVPLMLPIVSLDSSPSDGSDEILEVDGGLTFGASLGLQLRVGPVTARVSAIALGMGGRIVDRESGSELAELDFFGVLGFAQLQWNAPTIALGSGPRAARLALWPFAGARVLGIVGALDTRPVDFEEDIVRVSPYIGLETIVDFHGPWSIALSAAVGGFSVGLDISTLMDFAVEYRFTSWLLTRFGYFAYYAADGNTGNALLEEFNFLVHGPALAFRFTFQ